jgi:hypothetical protein
MAEYIERQAAIDALDRIFDNVPMQLTTEILRLRRELRGLPPADVAPVVRCENCIHWSDSNQCARPELSGSRWHDPKYFDTYPDDFCSYGERKE